MTERLTPVERAALDAAREYFNMMARMIHRAQMHRRGIGPGVELSAALGLGPAMEAHRIAVCRIETGNPLSDDYRHDVAQIALMLSTHLLSAWRCLLLEIVGGKSYPRPQLKTRRMYNLAPDGRGWTYTRLS